MNKIILFHGTSDEIVEPIYGRGEEKHDYGKGFYLTEDIELAKEIFALNDEDKELVKNLIKSLSMRNKKDK